MWTGDTQSAGGSYPTQWALNPSAYMNVPNEQVDWASLAQQWIKMKEGLGTTEKEQGEAPMELSKEETETVPVEQPPPPSTITPPSWPAGQPIDGTTWPNNWTWDQGGTGWCWSGGMGAETKVAPAPYTTPGGFPAVADPATVPAIAPQPAPFHYSPQQSNNQNYTSNSGYWTGSTSVKDNWESSCSRGSRKQPVVSEPMPELDLAKRKQLPAWIREGLEKMEREKQKKAESERLERQRLEELERRKEEEERHEEALEANGSQVLPKKSKFETDSEESENEKEVVVNEKNVEKSRKSRFDWRGPEQRSPPKPVFRTKEEIFQHVMTEVRKILTSLLMEVTTEEMKAVCEEVHSQFQRKAPATTLRKTPALASLTGKLGLGIYDSDSGSEASDQDGIVNGADSDQELRERILRRKEDFMDTERRIEKEITIQEEKERRILLGKQSSVSREGSVEPEEQVQPSLPGPAGEPKPEKKIVKETVEVKAVECREPKVEPKANRSSRERSEVKKEVDNKPTRRSERKSRRHSSVSSSSSGYSRSPSPYRRRKHGRHKKEKRSRRSHSRSRTRSRSRGRSRERRHRRKERRYRSGSSGRRRNRHRSSSSSSGGYSRKSSSHRR